MSYYYNENDIASTLKRAIAQGASYDEVDRLLSARKRKVDAGGEAMAQYKNDALMQEAEQYLASRRSHPSVDLQALRNAREQVAAENLKAANRNLRTNYQMGVQAANRDAAETKKAMHADYKRTAFLGEEMLANNGLGKGNRAPSSGYGESSRTAAFLSYQNALADAKREENRKKSDLLLAYQNGLNEQQNAYAKQRDTIAKEYTDAAVKQENADREFLLEESKHDADVNQWNQEFDAQLQKDMQEQNTEKQNKDFENALDVFKQTGVVTDEKQANILGLPVGTKSLGRTEFEDDSTRAWSVFERDNTWHTEEMAYRYTQLQSGGSGGSGVSQEVFDNNYALFKAVGEVITQEMANALNLPMGTKYWQYVTGMLEAERAQQKTDFDTGTWIVGE